MLSLNYLFIKHLPFHICSYTTDVCQHPTIDISQNITKKLVVYFGDLHLQYTYCLQGDLNLQGKKAVFLTVHDLGCNRKYCIASFICVVL